MTSFSRLCSLVNWSSLRVRTSSLAPPSRLLGRTLIAEMKYNDQKKVYLCMFVYIQPVINSMQTNHCIKNKHTISKYNYKLEWVIQKDHIYFGFSYWFTKTEIDYKSNHWTPLEQKLLINSNVSLLLLKYSIFLISLIDTWVNQVLE